MISQVEFSAQSMTANKQAMPEKTNFDGPAGIEVSGQQNSLAANSHTPIAKPGFNS